MILFTLSIILGFASLVSLFVGAIGPGIGLLLLAFICGYLIEVFQP